jgi:phosphonate transport system ATP-binding protein
MSAGRIVFDGAPAALTDSIARELYDLEAGEAMGEVPDFVPGELAPALGKSPRLRRSAAIDLTDPT